MNLYAIGRRHVAIGILDVGLSAQSWMYISVTNKVRLIVDYKQSD